ncbi:MAG: hypothetical protein ACKPE1_21185, partial [Dolichospermum sp.]
CLTQRREGRKSKSLKISNVAVSYRLTKKLKYKSGIWCRSHKYLGIKIGVAELGYEIPKLNL